MAGHHKEHHHGKHHHGKHHEEKEERKKGGRVGMVVSGNPDVLEEAHDDEDGAETGHERKHGGRAKKHHGKHHRAKGGKVLGLMTGGGVKARLDRPGRKRGGAVFSGTPGKAAFTTKGKTSISTASRLERICIFVEL